MATSIRLCRSSIPFPISIPTRPFSLLHSYYYSTKPPSNSHHKDHSKNEIYLEPTQFIGSWRTPTDPKAANYELAKLRRDYAKQVKEIRKQYIYEMEMQRQDLIRKDEARRVEIVRQRTERNKSKAAAALARATHRKAFEHDFRLTLMKERAEKLEYWRTREKTIEDNKHSKTELIRNQSSVWIDEDDLPAKAFAATVDSPRF